MCFCIQRLLFDENLRFMQEGKINAFLFLIGRIARGRKRSVLLECSALGLLSHCFNRSLWQY